MDKGHRFKTFTSQLVSQREKFFHITPVTPAGSFARCMLLVLQERRDQLAQILYQECKNLVS